MTTIITKYGYGVPGNGQLAKGELGVDLTDGILYSSTDGSDVIELGRGELEWNNIINLPPELTPDGDGYVDLTALEARVGVNEVDIAALKEAVANLESDLADANTEIGKNASAIEALDGRVEANETQIGLNKNSISTLNAQINDQGGLADQVSTNAENIGKNKTEIDNLKDLLDANLTGLVMGGEYNASTNTVSQVTQAGTDAGLTIGSALPTGEATKGLYVVVTTEGELAGTGGYNADGQSGRADGETAHVGDWLVSDGQHGWILFSFGMDAVNWGMIGGDLTNQSDLVEEFDKHIKFTDTIDCGTYSN